MNVSDFLGVEANANLPDKMYAVQPLSDCPHLENVNDPPNGWVPDVKKACKNCDNTVENWVCLTCYEVYCGRYSKKHMVDHYSSTQHSIVLSYADLSSWCYNCEAYIHNERLQEIKRKVHAVKFGQDIPNAGD